MKISFEDSAFDRDVSQPLSHQAQLEKQLHGNASD